MTKVNEEMTINGVTKTKEELARELKETPNSKDNGKEIKGTSKVRIRIRT